MNLDTLSSKPKIAINHDYLLRFQRFHAIWITNLLPLLGFIAGLALIPFWGFGWLEINTLLLTYVLTILGVEIGFHRLFSHKAYESYPFIKKFLAILGCMSAQGPLIYWAANHRRHHQYSDVPGDPHSPHLHGEENWWKGLYKGLWHAHVGWQYNHDTPNTAHFTKDLLKNKMLYKVNQNYYIWVILGILLPAFICMLIEGSWRGFVIGFLWGGLARIFLLNHITFSINSICHVWGKSPFHTNEHSKNNIWLSIVSFGQAWHNNHHAFPFSARLNFKWYQIDLGGMVIQLMKFTRLAWDLKVPSPQQIKSKLN